MQPNKCEPLLPNFSRTTVPQRPASSDRRSVPRVALSFLSSNIWIASASLNASGIPGSYAERNQRPSRDDKICYRSQMPLKEPEGRKQSVSLPIGSPFASAWESVLLPWFKEARLASLKNNETV